MNTPLTIRIPLFLGLVALLCFTTGCRDKNTTAPAPPDLPQLDGRLTAAAAISDSDKRDAALRAVADHAAQAGDAPTVKKAVREIGDSTKKDDAASSSALALAKAGKRADAADIAGAIGDTRKRDDTLSKLAGQ